MVGRHGRDWISIASKNETPSDANAPTCRVGIPVLSASNPASNETAIPKTGVLVDGT